MARAWQKREFEQRDILEKIMTYATRAIGDGDHDTFFLALALDLLGEIIKSRIADNQSIGKLPIGSYCKNIRENIDASSRTPEEAKELLSRILVMFADTGLSEVHRAYIRQTVEEPKRLYAGHEAMDDVPYLEP